MILSDKEVKLTEKRIKKMRKLNKQQKQRQLDCITYWLKKQCGLQMFIYLIFAKGESEPSWKLNRLVLTR
jgi:hypothetical protein